MFALYNGYSDSLRFINGKLYQILGEENGLYRIIDETGECYLYSLDDFTLINK